MPKIKIITSEVEMEAELNQSDTAKAIWEKLSIEGKVNTWGEEIYFEIPVEKELEDGVEVVKEGDLAYWPDGQCFCIFFGKTPASTETEIKPASAVTLIGKLLGDPKEWQKVKAGQKIIIEKALIDMSPSNEVYE